MDDLEHVRILALSAYLLLAISVVTGELLSGKLVAPSGRRRLFRVHRATSILGLVLGGAHGLSSAGIGSSVQLALGLAAVLSMAVPAAVWLARRRLISRWRDIHHVAYLAFFFATVHAVAFHGAMRPPEAGLYLAAVLAVIGLAIVRLARDRGLVSSLSGDSR